MHVLTVHFNTPEMTSSLVRSLPRTTPKGRALAIHILDNCSTLRNQRILRNNVEDLPGVKLEVSDKNVGFGEGINVLADSADFDESDIIWLLNPDTRPQSKCLGLLEDELDRRVFSVVSPLIYSGDGPDPWVWYCGGSIDTRQVRVRHHLYGSRVDESPQQSFETEFITGAAPMMRVSTFRTVGGFPRDYFLYWEDAYFCSKARDLGFRLGVVPTAHLWHAVGASSGLGQTRTFYYWFARNRFVFARDIGIPRRRLIVGTGGLESARNAAKALLERRGRGSKTRAAVRGTLEGFQRARRPR